jgi:hypothetical protein
MSDIESLWAREILPIDVCNNLTLWECWKNETYERHDARRDSQEWMLIDQLHECKIRRVIHWLIFVHA